MASGGSAVAWKDKVSYGEVAKANETALTSANAKKKPNAGEYADKGAAFVLPIAFLAGFILNFMPCVLPVIGLKLMSFVHQAGEEPGKVFKLNLVFVLGILAVFMVLAALAVFAGFGWGKAFESTLFKIIMIGVVFAFGISFFGVWEIPIPGLANSETANELAQKDGYSGQFFKGVLTTILATPCAGPMLIPAVIWAVAQPAWMTFTVFFALGMGMAVPYLIIGAFPKLISYLPKPGPWMETFKHVMGFVMLATVIFLLNAVNAKLTTAVLVFLLFVAFACWMLGREQLEGGFAKVMKRWGVAVATIAFGVWFSFYALISSHELNYEEYSRVALDSHLAEGRTVLVDFTADW